MNVAPPLDLPIAVLIAVLDSSVLVPAWSRITLQRIAAAPESPYVPAWSEWIIGETWRNLAQQWTARHGATLVPGERAAALRKVGPVLTPSEVAARLGVSGVTVNNWRRRKRLLAFRFDEHQYLYPAFQFIERPEHGERGVVRHLDEVLARLPFRSEWQRVQFFPARSPALAGKTPLDVLRGGDARWIARLLDVAEHAGDMGDLGYGRATIASDSACAL